MAFGMLPPTVNPVLQGWRGKLGQLSDLLTDSDHFGSQMRAQMEQDALERRAAQEQADANRAQVVQLGRGGFGTLRPQTGELTVLREPEVETPQMGEQERLIDAWYKLPPDDARKPLMERAIRGYGYTEAAQAPKIAAQAAIAAARGAQARMTKSTPSARSGGGGGGGGGVPRYEYRMGPSGQLQKRRVG